MGITVASPRWFLEVQKPFTPGSWIIRATNAGSMAALFEPLDIIVTAEKSTVEKMTFAVEGVNRKETVFHSPRAGGGGLLNPGESIDFILRLKLEGFSWTEGWDHGEFSFPEESLTAKISYGPSYLQDGRLSSLRSILPLPSWLESFHRSRVKPFAEG